MNGRIQISRHLQPFPVTYPETEVNKGEDPEPHVQLQESAELVGQHGGDGQTHGGRLLDHFRELSIRLSLSA